MIDSPVSYLKGHFILYRVSPLGKTAGHFTANHSPDYSFFSNIVLPFIQGFYSTAVPEDGYPVCTIVYFIQFMGYDYGCDILFVTQSQYQIKNLAGILFI